MKKKGAPSRYTEELADKIVDLIEQGYSERQIAAMDDMPSRMTIQRWKDEHPDFCDRSARAREASADRFNDQREETAEWLMEQVEQAAASGQPIPKGVVDGARAVMQELARSAALRDDSRFGDRKTVKLDAKSDGAGLADVYAKIAEAVKDGEK
jgi:hypothetical protein